MGATTVALIVWVDTRLPGWSLTHAHSLCRPRRGRRESMAGCRETHACCASCSSWSRSLKRTSYAMLGLHDAVRSANQLWRCETSCTATAHRYLLKEACSMTVKARMPRTSRIERRTVGVQDACAAQHACSQERSQCPRACRGLQRCNALPWHGAPSRPR